MLCAHPLTSYFVNGTVYQAFLTSKSYRQWHSPMAGRIVRASRVPGTCFSKVVQTHVHFDGSDSLDSQVYMTQVASQALIFIEAKNPHIGLMCVIPVGMGEYASCEITVREGQHVQKGYELSMFHFGGSTHCMFLRPDVGLEFDLGGQEPGPHARMIPVNSPIATVVSSSA